MSRKAAVRAVLRKASCAGKYILCTHIVRLIDLTPDFGLVTCVVAEITVSVCGDDCAAFKIKRVESLSAIPERLGFSQSERTWFSVVIQVPVSFWCLSSANFLKRKGGS